MAINTRRMRPVVVDGVSWHWRGLDRFWRNERLVVMRDDRRTVAWYIPGPRARVRVRRTPKDALDGVYWAPELPEYNEFGPRAAVALARWVEGPAPKERVVVDVDAALNPPLPAGWDALRAEGARWFDPEGDEEAVRAVIEERLQEPMIAPWLGELEQTLGPELSDRFTRECTEALVARGTLDDRWLRPETRCVGYGSTSLRDGVPWGTRGLRALWALAKAPRAVVEAERLAREYEARFRAFAAAEWLDSEPAELRWLVVDHPRVKENPVHRIADVFAWPMPYSEVLSTSVAAPADAIVALREDESARPFEALRPEYSKTNELPLIRMACEQWRAHRSWSLLLERGARTVGALPEAGVMHPRWEDRALTDVPWVTEPLDAILRLGFLLIDTLPGHMVLVAALEP
ncbi:MAG: hypothetical protein JNK05_39030 [Myxococcales bacterium]|nr:hypothetical protein [Myxococcales bacterium]